MSKRFIGSVPATQSLGSTLARCRHARDFMRGFLPAGATVSFRYSADRVFHIFFDYPDWKES